MILFEETDLSDHDGSAIKEKASKAGVLESSIGVGAEPPTLENLCEESYGSEDE